MAFVLDQHQTPLMPCREKRARLRMALGLPKEHYYDALCVGPSTPTTFTAWPAHIQVWSAKGRSHRQICGTNQYGFPIRHRPRQSDMVRAVVPRGKYAETWVGRLMARASGSFDITAHRHRVAQSIFHQHPPTKGRVAV